MKTEAQCKQILRFLKRGYRITPLEALELFGCNRLAARAYDLKQAGYPVESRMVEVASGKRVAQYSMRRKAA